MWVDVLSCRYLVALDEITSLPPHLQCCQPVERMSLLVGEFLEASRSPLGLDAMCYPRN